MMDLQTFTHYLAWIGSTVAVIGSLCLARNKRSLGFTLLLLSLGFSAPAQYTGRIWAQLVLFIFLAGSYTYGLYYTHKTLMEPSRG